MDAREFHRSSLDWSDMARAMVKQGPGWVLLGYIVWWGTKHAQAQMMSIETVVQTQVTTNINLANLMQAHIDGSLKYQRAMLELQTETCLNQANTAASAKKCRDILYNAEFAR